MGRLSGRTVVIARAAEQAGRLRALLEAEGAAVVEVPTIAIEPPADGDGALREALRDLWDWVVVTSPNGAERAVAAAGGRAAALALRWAVVGPGTADALAALGIHAALVPDRFVAEGLVEAFPDPPAGGGRVLLAQAEAARPVLADGLAGTGLGRVDRRRLPDGPGDPAVRRSCRPRRPPTPSPSRPARRSTATSAPPAPAPCPSVVVAIGPVTSAAVAAHGLEVAAEADPHSLAGLVEATVAALS